MALPDVRFGSLADIRAVLAGRPLSTNKRHGPRVRRTYAVCRLYARLSGKSAMCRTGRGWPWLRSNIACVPSSGRAKNRPTMHSLSA